MRKKSETSNLESRRRNFLHLGFVVATSLTLLAFEYQSGSRSVDGILLEDLNELPDEVVLKVQEIKEKPKTYKPPVEKTKKRNDVTIVKTIDPIISKTVFDTSTVITPIDPTINWDINGTDIVIIPDEGPSIDKIPDVVEQKAKYPGGQAALMTWLGKNIAYPQKAKDMGQSGKVYVQFIVEKDGSINSAEAIGGSGQKYKLLVNEAERATKGIPGKWEPAKNNGKVVRSYFKLPIKFELK